ncbi:uncharacterized protein Z518_07274 [Rhinocladiella mackenziei CBS 650.93]|uniref:Uncharacterized protein n=1 Tax=Rhinocladiella mackenziei CBS 650.93 TaxID=1442369 RepID=A0A0D2IKG3_9EURO|nr:uncharacterized protein Z518_07274 [Rhinocladiella mackenziei CBS 650.93]KIX03721.1 hypothetical protein Z518_07274 [Rhinocladiella mackenziei CBS 650.93]
MSLVFSKRPQPTLSNLPFKLTPAKTALAAEVLLAHFLSSPCPLSRPTLNLLFPTHNADRCQWVAEEIFRFMVGLPPISHLQNQRLIPVIFAVCEMKSTSEQLSCHLMAVEYYQRWKVQSDLAVFNTVIGLMETVWRLIDDGLDLENVWWSDVPRVFWTSSSSSGAMKAAVAWEDAGPGKD